MKYVGIAVGALTAIVATFILVGSMAGVLMSAEADLTAMEQDGGSGFLFMAITALARIAGGFVAGLLARRERNPGWVVGAGAAAGLLGSLVMLLGGVASGAAADLGDLLDLVLWTAQGALGGALAWLLVRPR